MPAKTTKQQDNREKLRLIGIQLPANIHVKSARVAKSGGELLVLASFRVLTKGVA